MIIVKKNSRLFFLPPPPTSHKLQYISVTSGFTRLSMRIKYVCRVLISLYVNFHNNRTMWSTNLHVKFCRWGGGKEKEPNSIIKICRWGQGKKSRVDSVRKKCLPPTPPPPPPPKPPLEGNALNVQRPPLFSTITKHLNFSFEKPILRCEPMVNQLTIVNILFFKPYFVTSFVQP